MSNWKNRIVSYGVKPADQFLANPDNARLHPQIQREAVKASLDTLGWIAPVIENARTGYLVDGHERVMQALADNADVPFITIELSEDEEKTALLTFDPITGLATYDTEKLDALLREVNTDSPALQQMLSSLAAPYQVATPDDWQNALGGLADGDRAPFQQMTFTLHDEQAEQVKAALSLAKGQGAFVDSPNENSNGNALARICETFLTLVGEDG